MLILKWGVVGVLLLGTVEFVCSGLGIAQLMGISAIDLGPICDSVRETAVLRAPGQPCWHVPTYPNVSVLTGRWWEAHLEEGLVP